jgi:hypothetical protein
MGISIQADDDAPLPRPTELVLTCDGGDHGLFGTVEMRYALGSYAENMQAAKRDGWLERHDRCGRLFLCPACAKR